MKKILVLGAGGFIGSHMVKRLKADGHWVRGVDIKYPEYGNSHADDFVRGDLRDRALVDRVIKFNSKNTNVFDIGIPEKIETFDEIYQFAADMGGAGFVFTGDNDAEIMQNSCMINLNLLESVRELNLALQENNTKIFYSSSACMYPEENQLDPDNPDCRESSAYPANPDSEYGWEKLFSERLFLAYSRNFEIPVRIARYHNIYGPEGTYDGGREKAPAALCRKVIDSISDSSNEIEVWGDGNQTRSFLYIDDCIEATIRLVNSDFSDPINIGSEEMVTIKKLAETAIEISGKPVSIRHKLDAPVGVMGRNSNNDLIRQVLKWDYSISLKDGLTNTFNWIKKQKQES